MWTTKHVSEPGCRQEPSSGADPGLSWRETASKCRSRSLFGRGNARENASGGASFLVPGQRARDRPRATGGQLEAVFLNNQQLYSRASGLKLASEPSCRQKSSHDAHLLKFPARIGLEQHRNWASTNSPIPRLVQVIKSQGMNSCPVPSPCQARTMGRCAS